MSVVPTQLSILEETHSSLKTSIYAVYKKEEKISKKELCVNYSKQGEYSTLEEAVAQAQKKALKKSGGVEWVVRIIPRDIGIGNKVYLTDISEYPTVDKETHYYGEIVGETESFWVIERGFDVSTKEAFFLKDEWIRRYLDGSFTTEDGVGVVGTL